MGGQTLLGAIGSPATSPIASEAWSCAAMAPGSMPRPRSCICKHGVGKPNSLLYTYKCAPWEFPWMCRAGKPMGFLALQLQMCSLCWSQVPGTIVLQVQASEASEMSAWGGWRGWPALGCQCSLTISKQTLAARRQSKLLLQIVRAAIWAICAVTRHRGICLLGFCASIKIFSVEWGESLFAALLS